MDTVQRVYSLLAEKNLTVYQLSGLSGVSYSTLHTAQKRGGELKVETIERICTALNISLSDFFRKE